MKITLSRNAAYQLRDRLNELLGVDEDSTLELYKVGIATEGGAEGYPYDDVNIYPEFCELTVRREEN